MNDVKDLILKSLAETNNPLVLRRKLTEPIIEHFWSERGDLAIFKEFQSFPLVLVILRFAYLQFINDPDHVDPAILEVRKKFYEIEPTRYRKETP